MSKNDLLTEHRNTNTEIYSKNDRPILFYNEKSGNKMGSNLIIKNWKQFVQLNQRGRYILIKAISQHNHHCTY